MNQITVAALLKKAQLPPGQIFGYAKNSESDPKKGYKPNVAFVETKEGKRLTVHKLNKPAIWFQNLDLNQSLWNHFRAIKETEYKVPRFIFPRIHYFTPEVVIYDHYAGESLDIGEHWITTSIVCAQELDHFFDRHGGNVPFARRRIQGGAIIWAFSKLEEWSNTIQEKTPDIYKRLRTNELGSKLTEAYRIFRDSTVTIRDCTPPTLLQTPTGSIVVLDPFLAPRPQGYNTTRFCAWSLLRMTDPSINLFREFDERVGRYSSAYIDARALFGLSCLGILFDLATGEAGKKRHPHTKVRFDEKLEALIRFVNLE